MGCSFMGNVRKTVMKSATVVGEYVPTLDEYDLDKNSITFHYHFVTKRQNILATYSYGNSKKP